MKRIILFCSILTLLSCSSDGTSPPTSRNIGGERSSLVSETKKRGTFCDQLRYIIVHGSNRFKELEGRKIGDNIYAALITLEGASQCFVYHSDILRRTYICVFDDESSTSLPSLKKMLYDLEYELDGCLIHQDFPSLGLGPGKRDPGVRYYKSSVSTSDRVSYQDRYRFNQDITLSLSKHLEDYYGPENDLIKLTVSIGSR